MEAFAFWRPLVHSSANIVCNVTEIGGKKLCRRVEMQEATVCIKFFLDPEKETLQS